MNNIEILLARQALRLSKIAHRNLYEQLKRKDIVKKNKYDAE